MNFRSMNDDVFTNIRLNCILESGETANPLDEISSLTTEICPAADCGLLCKVHQDVTSIYSGQHPGFEASVTKYHDLRHTYSVVLAAIRLLHGLYHENRRLPQDFVLQSLLSAYFHDAGMLPQSVAEAQSNGGYTKQHEKRSIAILDMYLRDNNFPDEYSKNCAMIIKYTILDREVEEADMEDRQLHLCGQVVGTADLLAQMADRYYLESLPLLFQEHQDSGMDKHSSAIDLMSGTLEFHEKVIKRRLRKTLGNVAYAMQTHFRKRWNIDRNLYLEGIDLNLDYLKKIMKDCSVDLSCWGKYLRRNPPAAKL